MCDFVNIYLCVAFSYLSLCNALQTCYTVIRIHTRAFVCYIPPPFPTNINYSPRLQASSSLTYSLNIQRKK